MSRRASPSHSVSPPSPAPPTPADQRGALLAMASAAFLFAAMSACTKAATRSNAHVPALSGGELAFYRYLFGILAMVGLALARPIDLWGGDRLGLIWRGFYGGIASSCFFVGIQYTTLTNATMLNYTFVIWGPLIAIFLLKEHPGKKGMLGILIGLCGVALVTRPEIGRIRVGDVVALASGFMAGAAQAQIRKLRQGETSYSIFFYFNLLGVPCALAALYFTGERFHTPTLGQMALIGLIGVTSTLAQLLMTYGYRALTTAQGGLLSLTTMVYSTSMAVLFFREPLTLTALFGGALILFSAVVLSRPPRKPSSNAVA